MPELDFLQSEDNTDIPVPLDIYEADAISSLPRQNMDIGQCDQQIWGQFVVTL